MKAINKIFTHTLLYALGPQIPKIASLFVLPIITKYLSSQDYGTYGLITSYTGIFSALADLGFSVVLVNSFFRYPHKWKFIWRQLHYYLLIWSWLYNTLVAFFLYWILPSDLHKEIWNIIILVALPGCLFAPTILIASRYYQFAQKPFYFAISSGIVGAVTILLNYVSIAIFKWGYIGWLFSSALGMLIQFLFYVWPIYFKYKLAPICKFRFDFLYKQLKVSLPTIPHNYSSYLLSSSDRVIMDRVGVSLQQIGRYNISYIFGNYFEFFGNAMGMAIGPIMTGLISQDNSKAKNDFIFFIKTLQWSFLLAGFIISIWAKELMKLLIRNDELNSSYPIAIIIIMGYVYRPYYWAAITKLQYSERTNQFWKISFIAGVLNVVCNLIFIPIFGIKAAAITTFFALLYMGFSGYFLDAFDKDLRAELKPSLNMIIIIITAVFAFTIKDFGYTNKIIISLLILSAYISFLWNSRYLIKNLQF